MVRMGIIGTGIIVKSHLAAIAIRDDIQLVAVCDVDEEKAKKAADATGAKVYLDYEKMLDEEKLDAVIINLPHFLHEPCTLACAARKVSVLLEKPMSVSSESCKRITDACHQAGVVLQIGHVQHYDPGVCKASELIREGAIGKLLLINDMRYDNYFLPTRPRWFLDTKTSGGGIMMNLGAHAIDKIRCLTGSDVETVTSRVSRERSEFNVEGSAQVMLTMKNGVSATISLCGYAVDHYCNVTYIFGTAGYMRLSAGKDLWMSQNGSELKQVDLSDYAPSFVAQLDDFMRAMNGAPVKCTGEYGGEIIATIEKVYELGGT